MDIKDKRIVRRKKQKRKNIIVIVTIIISSLFVFKIASNKKYEHVEAQEVEPLVKNKVEEKPSEEDLLREKKKEDTLNNEYLLLVNKTNKISQGYIPSDLVKPEIRANTANEMTSNVRAEVGKELELMFEDAKNCGIDLIAISGYRSYSYQSKVYKRNIKELGIEDTEKYVAEPGTSEHQTGLVMDVLSTDYSRLDEGFEDTNAFKWLYNNMSDYGFILRYPKGKEDITGYEYEPWHLRYVGREIAGEITNEGITLEEYLNY